MINSLLERPLDAGARVRVSARFRRGQCFIVFQPREPGRSELPNPLRVLARSHFIELQCAHDADAIKRRLIDKTHRPVVCNEDKNGKLRSSSENNWLLIIYALF